MESYSVSIERVKMDKNSDWANVADVKLMEPIVLVLTDKRYTSFMWKIIQLIKVV